MPGGSESLRLCCETRSGDNRMNLAIGEDFPGISRCNLEFIMNRTILLTILWSLSDSVVWAQDVVMSKEDETQSPSAVIPSQATNEPEPITEAVRVGEYSPSEPASDPTQIKVFKLKFSQAASTASLLSDLIPDSSFRVAADERTNSLIAIGTADQLLAVEALLQKLDEAENLSPSSPKSDDNQTTVRTSANELLQQVAQLRTDYEAANKHAHELAESLRRTSDNAKRAELRTSVQRAFTLRQSLLRAELLEIQTRLLKLSGRSTCENALPIRSWIDGLRICSGIIQMVDCENGSHQDKIRMPVLIRIVQAKGVELD